MKIGVNRGDGDLGDMPEYLGRYRLVRRISTGGMSHVYEARRESLAGVAPRVAIKVILPEHANDQNFQKLFVNEARIGSQLQHPNLVQIQDFEREGERFYLVMEFVEGPTLRRIISRCKRAGREVPLSLIAEIGRQMCEGLYYAHTATDERGEPQNLLHRDIKPGNIIVNPQGVVKILDFGISKVLEGVERNDGVKGTWGYMSPEQARGRGVNAVSDLWGVAVVLYELATLKRLFPGRDQGAIKAAMDSDDAARKAINLSGQYRPLVSVLVRALQRDPAARFKNAMEMAKALGELIPDPIVVREKLVDFQALCGAAPTGIATQEIPRSSSTMSRVSSVKPAGGGIPVSVGNAHRVIAPGEMKPDERPAARDSGGPSTFYLVVVGIAISTIVVTATALTRSMRGGTEVELTEVEAPSDRSWVPAEAVIREVEEVRVEDPHTNGMPSQVRETPAVAAPPVEEVAPPVEEVAPPPVEPEPVVTTPVVATTPTPPPQSIGSMSPASTAAVATGTVTISSLPRARLIIDGEFVRETPVRDHIIAVGSHEVVLEAEDGSRHRFRIDVVEGEEVRRIWHFGTGSWLQQ